MSSNRFFGKVRKIENGTLEVVVDNSKETVCLPWENGNKNLEIGNVVEVRIRYDRRSLGYIADVFCLKQENNITRGYHLKEIVLDKEVKL